MDICSFPVALKGSSWVNLSPSAGNSVKNRRVSRENQGIGGGPEALIKIYPRPTSLCYSLSLSLWCGYMCMMCVCLCVCGYMCAEVCMCRGQCHVLDLTFPLYLRQKLLWFTAELARLAGPRAS